MNKLALQLLDGQVIVDWTNLARNIKAENNEHGFGVLSFEVTLPLRARFRFYDRAPLAHLQLTGGGVVVWEGRVEDREITTDGLRLTAFGYWAALADDLYTALWSSTRTADWQVLTDDDISTATPEKYQIDRDNRLYLAPRKNENFGSAGDKGFVGIRIPSGSAKNMVGIQFELTFNAPADWEVILQRRDEDWGFLGTDWTLTSTGSTLFRGVYRTFSACAALTFQLRYNATAADYTGETGAAFVKITNLRVVTSTANAVNTTTGTTITAGADRVVTPADMTGIYLGQYLIIDSGSNPSELVYVKAVTATTFTADFTNAYAGTTNIDGHVVYADEVVADVLAAAGNLNPQQLSNSTVLIQSPGVDMWQVVFADARPGEVLNSLLGPDATGGRWEAGVWENRLLYYRPRGSLARHWYTDALELTVNSTVHTLYNQLYATYRDENGQTLRTDQAADSSSQAVYGLTRIGVTHTRTGSPTLAEVHRDAALGIHKEITPVSRIVAGGLYNASGGRVPLWLLRAGDTLTIRNLPPNLSADIDKIRTFTVHRHRYRPIEDTGNISPELDLPSLEVLVAGAYMPPPPSSEPVGAVSDSYNPLGGRPADTFNPFGA